MASSTPGTPIKRSFSLPIQPSRVSSSPDPTIEILYNLPSARIVAFTTNSTARPSSSNGSPVAEDQPGTLLWVSPFERTLAIGMPATSAILAECYIGLWLIWPVDTRCTAYLSSSWKCSIPELRECSSTDFTQVTVLVC